MLKIIFYKFFFIILFTSNLMSVESIEELIGKKIILNFADSSVCELNLFQNNDLTSNCFEGTLKYKTVTMDNGEKIISWKRSEEGKVYEQVIFLNNANILKYAWINKTDGGEFQFPEFKYEINNLLQDKEIFDELVFNKSGEAILLKKDGTWENQGKPNISSGIIVRNISAITEEYLYEGETREKCKLTVEVTNNTSIDLKEFGVSYKAYDEYDERKLFISMYGTATKIKPNESKKLRHDIPNNCDAYFNGGWYIEGDVNPYDLEAKDPNLTKDDISYFVVWSSDGILPFKNN